MQDITETLKSTPTIIIAIGLLYKQMKISMSSFGKILECVTLVVTCNTGNNYYTYATKMLHTCTFH